jgi:hypothetical protein
MTATMPGRASGSSTAAAIISRTVSKASRESSPTFARGYGGQAEKLSMKEKVDSQHLGDRENPLGMRDVG